MKDSYLSPRRRERPRKKGARVRVIGMGNAYRGDDGVGIWVACQVAAAGWDGVTAVTLNARDGTALFSAWEDADTAYVVDAVSADLLPGAIIRIDALRPSQATGISALSSHGLGLMEAIELGRALGLMPRRLILYGIAGYNFDHGSGLSPEVEQAAKRVLVRLQRVAARLRQHHA